jgi:3alpha(or 20beta)-hydroxysteroid dehydrogenase
LERLVGKVALVTGAASGIGEAIATAFVAEGCKVIVADIREDEGSAVSARLGSTAHFIRLDVIQTTQWSAAIEETVGKFGQLDILVNNAGCGIGHQRVDHESAEAHEWLLKVNITGVWNGIRAVIPVMKARGGGSIINTASINGLVGVAGMTTYAATKFAVTGMTRSTALELGDFGIRVNSVHPGSIETPAVAALDGNVRAQLVAAVSQQAIKRLGRPAEVANAFVFFASDESSYCSGSTLVVDGGAIAGRYRELADVE